MRLGEVKDLALSHAAGSDRAESQIQSISSPRATLTCNNVGETQGLFFFFTLWPKSCPTLWLDHGSNDHKDLQKEKKGRKEIKKKKEKKGRKEIFKKR